ncbi:MAG: hypothetical protein ACT4OJ_08550 [Bacteroidota bacterium]
MDNTIDKSIQREVQALLNWNAQQWAQHVYECALSYLQKLMPEYPQIVRQISSSKTFWNWWKHHWEKRDMEFIEQIDLSNDAIIDPVAEYLEKHDPRTLAEGIYLNGQVLEESYAQMIGAITKNQLQEVTT